MSRQVLPSPVHISGQLIAIARSASHYIDPTDTISDITGLTVTFVAPPRGTARLSIGFLAVASGNSEGTVGIVVTDNSDVNLTPDAESWVTGSVVVGGFVPMTLDRVIDSLTPGASVTWKVRGYGVFGGAWNAYAPMELAVYAA